jgi:hypothetical protein
VIDGLRDQTSHHIKRAERLRAKGPRTVASGRLANPGSSHSVTACRGTKSNHPHKIDQNNRNRWDGIEGNLRHRGIFSHSSKIERQQPRAGVRGDCQEICSDSIGGGEIQSSHRSSVQRRAAFVLGTDDEIGSTG